MSSQINFYMMPDDVAELDEYLKKNGWVIVASVTPTNQIKILSYLEESDRLISFLTRTENVKNIISTFIEKQNYWYVSESESEVIQYRKTLIKPDNNQITPGRLYYEKIKNIPNSSEIVNVSPDFLKSANKLFTWYKKHFINTKTTDYFTTPRAAEYIYNQKALVV